MLQRQQTFEKMNESTEYGGFASLLELPKEDSFYYKIEGLLVLFYLVHPKRTMCPTIDTPNFYILVRRFLSERCYLDILSQKD